MKQTNSFNPFFVIFALLFLYCAPSQNEKADMENLLATIAEFDNAYDNWDLNKVVDLFSEDGIFLPQEYEMIKGKQALREMALSADSGKYEFKRDKVEIKLVGKMAYEIVNQITTNYRENREPEILYQKYIHVWEKQKDGSWKLKIDMWNSRKPQ